MTYQTCQIHEVRAVSNTPLVWQSLDKNKIDKEDKQNVVPFVRSIVVYFRSGGSVFSTLEQLQLSPISHPACHIFGPYEGRRRKVKIWGLPRPSRAPDTKKLNSQNFIKLGKYLTNLGDIS